MEPSSSPRAAAVWYLTVSKEDAPGRGGWLLRVTMTTSVEGGAREDRYVPDIDAAVALLRQWFEHVRAGAR